MKDVVEVKFGYDGIVFASDADGPELRVRAEGLVPCLAAEVPGADGKLAANTNKTWKQVNASFPEWTIAAYIPARSTAPARCSRRRRCTPAA